MISKMTLRKNLPSIVIASLLLLCATLVPAHVFAQSVNFDFGAGPTTSSKLIQLVLLITVISLAPSILIMVTSFTRIVVVLSFVRQAMGLQSTPPSVILTSLALFLTLFIMQPTFDKAWESGIRPLMDNQLDEETGFIRAIEPFRDFMFKHARQKDIDLFVEMGKAADAKDAAGKTTLPPLSVTTPPGKATANAPAKSDVTAQEDVPLRALIPAFMISELRRAFEIGFLVFLPFLIIDMVVASILMSMGMMMLPPSIISLPFKIIFFVLVDGWYLIAGSLVQSYGGG